MIKNTLFAGLLLACSTSAMAQYEEPINIDFEIGTPYKVVDAVFGKSYVKTDKDIFALKIQRNQAIIQQFDPNSLEEIGKISLAMPKTFMLEGFKKVEDSFYIFYSIDNKESGTVQMFFRKVDIKKGEWADNEKNLFTASEKIADTPQPTHKATNDLRGYINSSRKFVILQSEDKSKLLICYRTAPKFKNDEVNFDRIGLFVYDGNLNEIWGGIHEMPYTEKEMDISDYYIGNNGSAYIIAHVLDKNPAIPIDKYSKPTQIQILKRDKGTVQFEGSTLNLKDKYISDLYLFESSNSDGMMATGYYSDVPYSKIAQGIFTASLSGNLRLTSLTTQTIPEKLLTQYDKTQSISKYGIPPSKKVHPYHQLQVKEIFPMADGSYLHIGEQIFSIRQTTTYNGTGSVYDYYFYNDIIVSKIDSSGELEWASRIPKFQVGGEVEVMVSYRHIFNNGQHFFFYSDNPKNTTKGLDEALEIYSDTSPAVLMAVTVDDKNGAMRKHTILNYDNINKIRLTQLRMSKNLQISDEEFIFEAYKKKKEDVLVKIHLGS